jgi:hypothetical protein
VTTPPSRGRGVASYAEFLERKAQRAPTVGRRVDVGQVNPMLYDWQRAGVAWAVRTGRAALLWDCGLGKTFAQLEWARLSAERTLILAPLSVARQTEREAAKLGVEVRYVRSGDQAAGPGVWITNYEMADRFEPASFGAVVLDESSVLKNVDGKTRRRLPSPTPHRTGGRWDWAHARPPVEDGLRVSLELTAQGAAS